MADESEEELLTLQDAADRLKVHYMTAYRWVRRGDLPAFKAGGRLRVRAEDVQRFVQQREVDVVTPAHTGRTDWPTHLGRFLPLLIDGRGVDAANLIRKVIADGAPAGQVYLELLTPALHEIGAAWARGELTVAEEHRAAEITMGIMARMSDGFRRRGPARGTAVTLTPPDEHHGIGANMVADFLRAGGYDVHHLGVNVPLRDLQMFLKLVPCDVLCASVTTPSNNGSTYSSLVDIVAEQDTLVVFGGQGVDREHAEAAGAIAVDSLVDLVATLNARAAR